MDLFNDPVLEKSFLEKNERGVMVPNRYHDAIVKAFLYGQFLAVITCIRGREMPFYTQSIEMPIRRKGGDLSQ